MSITWHSFEMLQYSPINQHHPQIAMMQDMFVKSKDTGWETGHIEKLQTCSHVLRSDIHPMRVVPTVNLNQTVMMNYFHQEIDTTLTKPYMALNLI